MRDKRKIKIEDLLLIKEVGNISISPDGRKCVFTVKSIDKEKNKYFSHLHILDLNTREYFQFTYGEVFDSFPKWSKDGKNIFFIRNKENDIQIWKIRVDGGEAQQITNLPEGKIGEFDVLDKIVFTFRPKGNEWTKEAVEERKKTGKSDPPRIITKIYYKLDGYGFLDNYQKLWIAEENGNTYQLTDGEYDDYSPIFIENGNKVAFFSNRSNDPENTPYLVDLWTISIEDKKLEKINTFPGYKHQLSSFKDKLIFVGYESEEDPWIPKNNKLWMIDLSNNKIECLTKNLDRNVGNVTLSDTREINDTPKFSKDGKEIYFSVSDKGNCHIYKCNLENKEILQVTRGSIDISSFDVGKEFLVLTINTPIYPTEIYIKNKDKAEESNEKITSFNKWIEEIDLSYPEEVWYDSFDGERIQGWILKPPDFEETKKYPLLLYIHGGPHAQYGNTFFHEFHVHSANGFVVFYTNPRGSEGREEKFASIIRGDWGNIDYKDIMSGVEFIISKDFIDRERLVVAGGSYGGYMTNWIIGKTNIFKRAVTDRSVVDLVSMASTTDFPFMEDGYWEGNFWDNTEKLVLQSPLYYARNINTPLLIIHSEGDLRCPISQAEQLYITLKRLKKEVVFVRYPANTSHGMSRNGPPDLRIDRLQRIVEWISKV